MIIGIGTDIVEVDRINRLVAKYGQRFLDRIFTAVEQDVCLGAANQGQRLAARFAAKESVMKALGTGWARGIRFKDIEIPSSEKQRPQVQLRGAAAERARELGGTTWHLSLTHVDRFAVAFVVLEGPGTAQA